ncbi:MAG: hypothetical protein ACI4W2_02855 [Eubacterium sp.]
MVDWNGLFQFGLLLLAVAKFFYEIGKRKWPPKPSKLLSGQNR